LSPTFASCVQAHPAARDPRSFPTRRSSDLATRALIALMDLSAVNGGAACHWGGPSAMTETWTALHGIMFKEQNWFEKFNFVNNIDRKSTRLNSSHVKISYAVFCLKNKIKLR